MNRVKNQKGFAIVEIALIIVVIGLIAGLGWWVSKNKPANNSKDPSKSSQQSKIDPSKIGTLTGVDQVNEASIDDELKADDELAKQEEQDALDDIQAVKESGEGYEADL